MRPRPLALLLALAGCGDNLPPTGEEPPVAAGTCDEGDLRATLAALPNMMGFEELRCGSGVFGPARCFDIRFSQPIDHADPGGPHLTQRLYLIHRGCDRPNLVGDWGYEGFGFLDDELGVLFRTNTLWIEHRYQGESVPAAADWDWTALTIANGAGDMHEVIASFRHHYGGRWVSTGASKGGITASYHKYIYGADVDGAIPYVAPASRARVDPAYQTYLDTALPSPCARDLRDAQVAALTTRRAMMLERLASHAPGQEPMLLELITASIDWGFWQYFGVHHCDQVPTATTPDDAFFGFFASYSGLGFAAPAVTDEMRHGALEYEWLTEQGFALQINPQVRPLLQEPFAIVTMEDRFRTQFPDVALPAYDGTLTASTRSWMHDLAEDVLLIYGEYDPWSGGAMDEPASASSARFFAPGATHAAQLADLEPADRAAALELATRMFGVPPVASKRDARRAGAQLRELLARHHLRRRGAELHRLVRQAVPAR